RLVYLAFHGSPAGDDRHPGTPAAAAHHLHDAPPAMAIALIVLAVGSGPAGMGGGPPALGGSHRIGQVLAPRLVQVQRRPSDTAPAEQARPDLSAPARDAGSVPLAEHQEAEAGTFEVGLMFLSIVVAIVGVAISSFFFLKNKRAADEAATRFAGVY